MKREPRSLLGLAGLLSLLILGIAWWGGSQGPPALEPPPADPGSVRVPHLEDGGVDRVGQPVEISAGPGASARVTLLDVLTRAEPLSAPWSFEPVSAGISENDGGPGRDGAWVLPPGTWRLLCADPDWRALQANPITLLPGDNLLWVARRATIDVLVVDDWGRGIPDAELRWVWKRPGIDSSGSQGFWDETQVGVSAQTDPEGRASLDLALAHGTLYVRASGFENTSRALLGSASLRVTMKRVGALPDDLAIVGLMSGRPLEGVTLWSRTGPVTLPSGPDGMVRFTSTPSLILRANGAGVLPTQFRFTGATSRLAVHEACLLTVQVLEGEEAWDAGSVLVFTECASADQSPMQPIADQRALYQPGTGFTVRVPMGCRTTLLAADRGGSARGSIVPLTSAEQVTLRVERSPSLLVQLPAESTHDVRVEYANNAVVNEAARVGAELTVPHPDLVRRLLVSPFGHAPLEFQHHPGAPQDGAFDGTLRPSWVGAHEVVLGVKDEEGRPVAGLSMTFSPQASVQGHPELHGFEPTNHPGWVQRPHTMRRAVTDAQGVLRVALEEMTYTVLTELEQDVPNNRSAYAFAYSLSVHGPTEQQWTVPGVRLVTVIGYHPDATPVEDLRVTPSRVLAGLDSEGQGDRWQGWLPSGEIELVVSSSRGRRSCRVLLGADDHSLEVVLGDASGAIRLLDAVRRGAPDRLIGGHLVVRARESMQAGSPLLWEGRVPIEDPRWIPLEIAARDAIVEVVFDHDRAEEFTLTPAVRRWYPGAVIEFEVSPVRR